MKVLPPQAVRAPEVVIEQPDDSAERMQHEPLADEAGRIGQAIRKARVGRKQQQTRCPDAVGSEHDHGGILEMVLALGINIHGTGDQA